jgi:hypothetical protein
MAAGDGLAGDGAGLVGVVAVVMAAERRIVV